MNQDTLRKYARTLLQYGVNLQQDQTLVISVDVENKVCNLLQRIKERLETNKTDDILE